jgi:hypothetical protein
MMTMSGKGRMRTNNTITHAQFLGRISVAMRRKKEAAEHSKAINPSNNLG